MLRKDLIVIYDPIFLTNRVIKFLLQHSSFSSGLFAEAVPVNPNLISTVMRIATMKKWLVI